MTRTITTKATVEQTNALGAYLSDRNVSPEQAMNWLKHKHYTVKGIHYEASRVAQFIAGRQSAGISSNTDTLLNALDACKNIKQVRALVAQYRATQSDA